MADGELVDFGQSAFRQYLAMAWMCRSGQLNVPRVDARFYLEHVARKRARL